MTRPDWAKIEAIFDQGLSKGFTARSRLLDDECSEDGVTRDRVEALWSNHKEDDQIFQFKELVAEQHRPPDEAPAGERTYQILDEIASGGMGVVYKAQQKKPIPRIVAVKLLSAPLVSKESYYRFLDEQRVLAMMEHPYIAAVYDSGVTPNGAPFYTMAFIDGLELLTYCDQAQLSIRARLELFQKICEGIHHAHQKGVIHRDLKPSNILVVEQDGVPVPKIIDFGIAKILDRDHAEDLSKTRHGDIIGTPYYMSPEQAAGHPVDTRTDIYALGVLLYELLVGVKPLHREIAAAGIHGLADIIREQRPDTFKQVLSQTTVGSAAAARATEPRLLFRQLTGDLEAITFKALEKDPEDRYGSCLALRDDLQRFLNHQSISARHPTGLSLMTKWIRRNRQWASAFALLILILVLGLVREYMANERLRAKTDEAATTYEILDDFLRSMDPDASGREITVLERIREQERTLAARCQGQPAVEASLRISIGESLHSLGFFEDAMAHFQRAYHLRLDVLGPRHVDTLMAKAYTALALRDLDQLDQAEAGFNEVINPLAQQLGPDDTDVLKVRGWLAYLYAKTRDFQRAETEYHLCLSRLPSRGELYLTLQSGMALVLMRTHRVDEAERKFEAVLSSQIQTLGTDHSATLATRNNYANLLCESGLFRKAEPIYRETLEIQRTKFGDHDPRTLNSQLNLAYVLTKIGMVDEAEVLFAAVFPLLKSELGSHHRATLKAAANYSDLLARQHRVDEALAVLTILDDFQAPASPSTEWLMAMNNRGDLWRRVGRYEDSERVLRQTHQLKVERLGANDPSTLITALTLGETLQAKGDFQAALTLYLKVRCILQTRGGAEFLKEQSERMFWACAHELPASPSREAQWQSWWASFEQAGFPEQGVPALVDRVVAWGGLKAQE